MSLQLYHLRFKAMGSPCELALYMDANSATQKLAAIRQLIDNYEAKYSRYQSQSIVSFINQSAGGSKPVKVDDETAALLNYANVLFDQSEGLFDITSGVLRKIWDFKNNKVPSETERKSLLKFIGWKKVKWEPPYILLPAQMQLDFGGIVKEYVADTIAKHCLMKGIQNGLINLGGDIRVIGPHLNGKSWRVGIQHPRKSGEAITRIEISHGAIATSGDYERCMTVGEKRYSHLLNPLTGESISSRWASVSVIAAECVIAGSYSTLALLTSEERGLALLAESGLPYLCISQDIQLSGTMLHTAHVSSEDSDEILINIT